MFFLQSLRPICQNAVSPKTRAIPTLHVYALGQYDMSEPKPPVHINHWGISLQLQSD